MPGRILERCNLLNKRYNSINDYLKDIFGTRVYKVSLTLGSGCPNRDGTIANGGCIFCNDLSHTTATAAKRGMVSPDIKTQLEEGMGYVKNRHQSSKFISYFQSGTNTYASIHILESAFSEAISHKDVVGLAISTRPDCINKEHVRLFKDLSKKTFLWVELGLQSAHDDTLKFINRGHTCRDFVKTTRELNSNGIKVCAHVILGLPNEDKEMVIDTAKCLNENKVWGVKIHNLHILRDTRLAEMYKEGKIKILDLKTYARLVINFLEVLNPEIIIHRINSHSPRDITIAPEWSINKLAIFNEVERLMSEEETWQGKYF